MKYLPRLVVLVAALTLAGGCGGEPVAIDSDGKVELLQGHGSVELWGISIDAPHAGDGAASSALTGNADAEGRMHSVCDIELGRHHIKAQRTAEGPVQLMIDYKSYGEFQSGDKVVLEADGRILVNGEARVALPSGQ